MTVQDQILAELAEIQRTLGTVEGAIHSLEENVSTQGTTSDQYREAITSGLNNALLRIAAIENEVKSIKSTIEKTLKPLATGAVNMRQRIMAFSLHGLCLLLEPVVWFGYSLQVLENWLR